MTSLLITGATGSVGSAVVKHYLKTSDFDRIVVFSRDELKQSEMRKELPDERLRFFLGDVRDAQRIRRATEGVDTIVHCAALKRIESGETNPIEVVRTNVDGTVNVIDAALDNNVRRVVAISTDKAVEPTCLYGSTKQVMESLVLHAKAYTGHRRTTFAVVRMGNIVNSRGSVIPYWNKLKAQGKSLPVTDTRMTRYWVPLEAAQKLIAHAVGGDPQEVAFVPSIYTPPRLAFRITDLLKAYAHNWHTIGLRDGEKLHEKMNALDSSEQPERWVTIEELREAIACCS